MESPVVVDKPPEYHGNLNNEEHRGFPFEEEEGGAWSSLAARHPDIAARLRQRPALWARKRPTSAHSHDFDESLSDFDRFPFDDIPTEFREHFPSHWQRRFSSEARPHPTAPSPPQASQQTIATQTEPNPDTEDRPDTNLPQYGLRNTVDLGQKSPPDVDDRQQRSMSAPPDSKQTKMSGPNHQEQSEQGSNVRHIPIFVEGRDEPVINKSVDHGTHFGDVKAGFAPPQQDREQYFGDDGTSFHQPPNFSRSFGTPFNKGFRQGPQPFVQQKVYPQTAFARGASPQRSQSPKPQTHPEEHYVKVPVHHERSTPKAERKQQEKPMQQPGPQQQQKARTPVPEESRDTPSPKPQQAPVSNDPITVILGIQTDVLNLMSEVENFSGTKNDKQYLFLDEMLTRNLIKLDNIETEGKENIRQARKEAIKCIQKCIAVLEAKADANKGNEKRDAEVEVSQNEFPAEQNTESAERSNDNDAAMEVANKDNKGQTEQAVSTQNEIQPTTDNQVNSQEDVNSMQVSDTRPEEKTDNKLEPNKNKVDKKASPKKSKNVKKRDKSKDKKEKDSHKEQMQVDEKGEKPEETQAMEIDGATASQS